MLLILLSFLFVGLNAETLPSAEENIDAVKDWSKRRITDAEQSFSTQNLKRFPSPFYWGDQVVYQIQVDRFNNGDERNDSKNLSEYQKKHQNVDQLGLADYRHGGDLQGIINRLPYLKQLGVSNLWITPVFFNENGSYHAYCTSDFTKVDPGFGSNELLREFVRKAHALNIYVTLDIVINHLCDSKTQYQKNKDVYKSCTQGMSNKYWTGSNANIDQLEINFSKQFFPPFRSKYFLTRCGYKSGDFAGEGPPATFGDFSPEMFDLDTMNYDFQVIYSNIMKWWIAYADIDGFRLDAAKHVTADFVARLSTELRDYANSIGKNNFFLIGEIASDGRSISNFVGKMNLSEAPAALTTIVPKLKNLFSIHKMWPHPGLNAVYDFEASGASAEMWRRSASPRRLKNRYYDGGENASDRKSESYRYIYDSGDTNFNWNVLEIHDWPRFALWGASEKQQIGAMQQLIFSRGTPVIYYGYEQGFNGSCDESKIENVSAKAREEIINICRSADVFNHARYRQDMFANGPWRLGSTVASIQKLRGIGYVEDTKNDIYARTDLNIFKALKQANLIRQSCKALRRGEIYFRAAHDAQSGGLLAFSRILDDQEILVLANNSAKNIPIKRLLIDASVNGQAGQKWVNLLNTNENGSVTTINGQRFLEFREELNLNESSVAIFVNERGVAISNGQAVCKS